MSKTIKVIIGIIVIALVILGLISINKNNQISTDEPIKIGISTLLTGDYAVLGENIVKAAELSVKEINDTGGINGRKIELLVQDAGVDSKTGLAAAQKLINTDRVKYIIGGTSSNGTLAAAPVANQNKVVYMTPVTGGSNVDNAGEYIFRTANSDLLAGKNIAESMLKLGYKNVGIVAEVTEYTLDIKKTFEKTILERGGNLVISEEFQPGTTDFRTILTKVKSVKPEAVAILSQTGIGGGHFLKQSRDLGLSITFFSDFNFVANENAKKIVGTFEGIYFADPAYDINDPKTKAFFDLYKETYGQPSAIPFHAASTYDNIQMLGAALKAVGDDSEEVHDWLLENVKNWDGLMGTYSLDEHGNSDLGFVMRQIKNGQPIEVK